MMQQFRLERSPMLHRIQGQLSQMLYGLVPCHAMPCHAMPVAMAEDMC